MEGRAVPLISGRVAAVLQQSQNGMWCRWLLDSGIAAQELSHGILLIQKGHITSLNTQQSLSVTMASVAKSVLTSQAPAPSPLMSQAVKYNGMVYCSGSLGIDPTTNDFVKGNFRDRVVRRSRIKVDSYEALTSPQRQALINLDRVLHASNSSLLQVVKVNIFITSQSLFEELNEVYAEFFTQEVKPVRALDL